MPVRFSVNGPAFDKELKRSLSLKSSQKAILNNLANFSTKVFNFSIL